MKNTLNTFKIMPASEKVLIVFMIFTVMFFFVQSALPLDKSVEQSDKVASAVGGAVDKVTNVAGAIVDKVTGNDKPADNENDKPMADEKPKDEKPVEDETSPFGDFVRKNMRKIAHFGEYGVLGIEMALLFYFFTKKRLFGLVNLTVAALLIAFSDETIQIFSGRGASLKDVWLDFSGFLTFGILTLSVLYIVQKLKRKNI